MNAAAAARPRSDSAARNSLGSQEGCVAKLTQSFIEHFACFAGNWVPELHEGWSTSPVHSAKAFLEAASHMSLLSF